MGTSSRSYRLLLKHCHWFFFLPTRHEGFFYTLVSRDYRSFSKLLCCSFIVQLSHPYSNQPNQGRDQSLFCFYWMSLTLPRLVRIVHRPRPWHFSLYLVDTSHIFPTISTSWDDCAQIGLDKKVNLPQYFIHDVNVDWFCCGSYDFRFTFQSPMIQESEAWLV